MEKQRKINWGRVIFWTVAIAAAVWLLFTFLIYPNLNLFGITLFPEGSFDIQPLINVISSERAVESLRNSLLLGILVAVTTNVIGIFQVLVLDYFEIKGRKFLNILYYLPLVLNGMVLVLAYNYLIGTNGLITTWLQGVFPSLPNDWMLGLPAVLFQLSFSNTIYHITFVRDSLNNLDYQTIESARNMGASTWSILKKVVLPTLLPSILAATILNFNMGISAFASPNVLGGANFETINPLVYTFSQTNTTRNYAVILSVFLGLMTFIVLSIFNYVQKRRNVVSVSKTKTPLQRQKIENPIANALVTFFAYLIVVIQIIPAILVVFLSFSQYDNLVTGQLNFSDLTFENYTNVFASPSGIQPVLVSTIFALTASIVAIILILIFARWITKYDNWATRILEGILTIPWFVPATLVALGILFTFNTGRVLVFNQVLTGTFYVLIIGYIILRLPTNLRIIKAGYLGIDNSLEDASKNLGASTFSTYTKVLLPILMPTILSTLLLSFIALFAEFDMSVFLFHPLYTPLGVVINQATGAEAAPSSVMLSFVYGVLVMLISIIATYLVYGRRGRKTV